MNNKKISCVAKNNEINPPKTRTVTVQMNRKSDFLNYSFHFYILCASASHLGEDLAKAEFSHRRSQSSNSLRGDFSKMVILLKQECKS